MSDVVEIASTHARIKVLITGARTWMNKALIQEDLRALPPGSILVHGACETGADKIADDEARALVTTNNLEVRAYPAEWDAFARRGNLKAAGPARNSEIIRKEHPDKDGLPFTFGLAYSQNLERSRGTKDMVLKARQAGIKMIERTGIRDASLRVLHRI